MPYNKNVTYEFKSILYKMSKCVEIEVKNSKIAVGVVR